MTNSPQQQLLYAFETHSVPEIQAALDAGVDPNGPIAGNERTPEIERNRTPMEWLTIMYTRSPRFPACMRTMIDAGGIFDDPVLEQVLLDDAASLTDAIELDRSCIERRFTLISAYTSLVDVTLLHIAAEYGNANAARVLIDHGADLEARAGTDAAGLNGHTPIFHTVNSNNDHCAPVMRQLLDAGARVDVFLPGITWGKGMEWETTFFDVTPIAYAQMGLLPQVHRNERDIYANIELLIKASGRPVPPLGNVPNRYVARRRKA